MRMKSALGLQTSFKRVGSSFFKPIVFVAIIFLGTCITSYAQDNATDHDWIRTEIYFGHTDRNNKPINNEAWLTFVHRSLTSAFHDGFTIIRATGGWTDKNHHFYEEPSRVLIVVYPKAQAQVFDE